MNPVQEGAAPPLAAMRAPGTGRRRCWSREDKMRGGRRERQGLREKGGEGWRGEGRNGGRKRAGEGGRGRGGGREKVAELENKRELESRDIHIERNRKYIQRQRRSHA